MGVPHNYGPCFTSGCWRRLWSWLLCRYCSQPDGSLLPAGCGLYFHPCGLRHGLYDQEQLSPSTDGAAAPGGTSACACLIFSHARSDSPARARNVACAILNPSRRSVKAVSLVARSKRPRADSSSAKLVARRASYWPINASASAASSRKSPSSDLPTECLYSSITVCSWPPWP